MRGMQRGNQSATSSPPVGTPSDLSPPCRPGLPRAAELSKGSIATAQLANVTAATAAVKGKPFGAGRDILGEQRGLRAPPQRITPGHVTDSRRPLRGSPTRDGALVDFRRRYGPVSASPVPSSPSVSGLVRMGSTSMAVVISRRRSDEGGAYMTPRIPREVNTSTSFPAKISVDFRRIAAGAVHCRWTPLSGSDRRCGVLC